MPRGLKISFILIAFFLFFAGTWEKPQQIEKRSIYDTKTAEKYDKARSIYVGEEPEGQPPKGWFWWKNAQDFKMSTAWSEPAKRRFQALIEDESIPESDRRSMLKWVRPKIDLDTPWIDAKTGAAVNYIVAKVDTFKLFTVFKLCDPAGRPLDGTVEQDFKGQAKIYNLDRDSQYKIVCFDANGVVGTSVTALSDRFIRVYQDQRWEAYLYGRSLGIDKNQTIYTAYYDNTTSPRNVRVSRIEANGNINWNKGFNYSTTDLNGSEIHIDENNNLVLIVTDVAGGTPQLKTNKIDIVDGTEIWQNTNFGCLNSPLRNDIVRLESNGYVALVGTNVFWKIDSESGNSTFWKANSNGTPGYLTLTLAAAVCMTKNHYNDRIIMAGSDIYGYGVIDISSGTTIASGTSYGSPRFVFELGGSLSWVDTSDPCYVGLDFPSGKVINTLTFGWNSTNCSSGAKNGTAKIQGSNGGGWTTLMTLGCSATSGTTVMGNSTSYTSYRIYLENTDGNANVDYLLFHADEYYGTGNCIFAVKADDSNYNSPAGRMLAKGNFNTAGTFVDVCEGHDGNYTAVGFTTGHAGTFIASMGPSGVTKWEKTYTTMGYPQSIAPCDDKGYIVSGSDNEPSSLLTDAIATIMKIDRYGNYQWHKQFKPEKTYNYVTTSFTDAIETIDRGFLAMGAYNYSNLGGGNVYRIPYIVKTNRHGESCSPGVPCE